MDVAHFLFYGSLNDFLPDQMKRYWIDYPLKDEKPSVKHTIEAIGIPHTEVNVILVNGRSVDFSYSIINNDRLEVYPVGYTIPNAKIIFLSQQPSYPIKFIADVHLGKLAKKLRLLGFDIFYKNYMDDKELVETALKEHRVLLTRDVVLLKHKLLSQAYFIRPVIVDRQLEEVIERFQLKHQLHPFARCVECNGKIVAVAKDAVMDRLLPKTKLFYNEFYQCTCCERIYWKGSHYEQIQEFLRTIL